MFKQYKFTFHKSTNASWKGEVEIRAISMEDALKDFYKMFNQNIGVIITKIEVIE